MYKGQLIFFIVCTIVSSTLQTAPTCKYVLYRRLILATATSRCPALVLYIPQINSSYVNRPFYVTDLREFINSGPLWRRFWWCVKSQREVLQHPPFAYHMLILLGHQRAIVSTQNLYHSFVPLHDIHLFRCPFASFPAPLSVVFKSLMNTLWIAKKNESWALIQWIVDGHEYSYQFNLRRFIFVSFGPLFTTLAYFTGLDKLSCSWCMANSIT